MLSRHALTVLVAAALWTTAVAQETAAPSLQLQTAVETAIARHPRVHVAARDGDAREGSVIAASEPFDLRLSTLVGGHRENQVTGLSPSRTDSLVYGVVGTRQLRTGTLVQSEFSLTGASVVAASRTPFGLASVKLSVLVPLQKDRGGVLSGGAERSAQYQLGAARWRMRQAIVDVAYAVTTAYWNYVAARARRGILAESEARAGRLVEETRVLIRADERTAADLTQLLGNLSAKYAARLTADLAIRAAWQQLVLAMGIEASAVSQAIPPVTPFPAVVSGRPTPRVDTLVRLAQLNRADLSAIAEDVNASQALLGAARSDLKNRLDVIVNGGYKGRDAGGGADRFFAPLFRSVAGLDASIQVRYEFLGSNAAARGRLLQYTAAFEQQRIARNDVERQIAAEVAIGAEALHYSGEALAASQEAGRLFDEGVQNEERKFRLGMSTLFDVIQAADGLTNARLTEVAAQRDYAVAIATLRYQVGTLVRFDRERPIVDVEELLTSP